MKQRSNCYFSSSCACKSHLNLPSIQQLIANGEQIDEHYFNNLPSRDRKMLQKLIKSHEDYDNPRNRLVSFGGGSDQIGSKYKTPLNIDKSCCSCCNYCSCYCKPKVNRNTKKHLVHSHYLRQIDAEKYTKTSRKRFGSRNLTAIRSIQSDSKNIYSDTCLPCFCTSLSTHSSNAFFKKRAIRIDRLGTSGLNKSYTRLKSRPKKISYEEKFQSNNSSGSKKALLTLQHKNQGDWANKKKYLSENVPCIARLKPRDDEVCFHVPKEYEPHEYRPIKRTQRSRASEPYKINLKPVSSMIYVDTRPIYTQKGRVHSKNVLSLLRENVGSRKRLNKNSEVEKKNSVIPLEKKTGAIEKAQHKLTRASYFQEHSQKHEKLINNKTIKPENRSAFAHKDIKFLFCEYASPIYLPRLSYESERLRSRNIEQKNKISDPRLTRLAYKKGSSSKVKSTKSPYFQLNAPNKRTAITDYYHPIIKESQNSEVFSKVPISKRGYDAKLTGTLQVKKKEKRLREYELLDPIHSLSKNTSRTRNFKHRLTTGKCASYICVPNICDSYYRFKKKQRKSNKRYRDKSISTEKCNRSAISMTSSCNCNKSRNTQFRTAEPVIYNSKLKRRRERTESNNPPSLQAFRDRSNAGFNMNFYNHPSTSDIKGKVILAKCQTDSNLTSAKKTQSKNKRYLSEHSTLQVNTINTIKSRSSGIGHIFQIFSRPYNHKNRRKRMQRRGFPKTTRQKRIYRTPFHKFTEMNQLGQEKEGYVTKSILKARKRNSEPKIVNLHTFNKNFDQYESMPTNNGKKQNRFQTHDLKKTVSFISTTDNSPKNSRHSAPNFRKQAKYQSTKYYYLTDNHKEMTDDPYYDFNVSQENKKIRHPILKGYECGPGFCTQNSNPVERLKRIKTRFKSPKQTNIDSTIGSITRDNDSEFKVSIQPKRVTHFESNIILRKSGNNYIENETKSYYKNLHQKNSFPQNENIDKDKYKFRKDSRITLKRKPKIFDFPSKTNKRKSRIALVKNQYGSMVYRENRITMKKVLSKLLSLSTNSGKFRKLRNIRTNRSTRLARSHTIPRMPVELEKILMMPPHRRVFTVGSDLHLSIQFYKEDNPDLDYTAFNANEGHSVSRSMSTHQRAPSSSVKGQSFGAFNILKKTIVKEDKEPKTYHSNGSTNEEEIKRQIKHDIVKKKKIKSRIKNKKSFHKNEFSEKENISQNKYNKSKMIGRKVKSASLTKVFDKVSKSKGKLPHTASNSVYKSQNEKLSECSYENSALNEPENEFCLCEQKARNTNGQFSNGRTSQGCDKRRNKNQNKHKLYNGNNEIVKSAVYSYDKSTLTKERNSNIFYECETNICVPGVCDPNVCFKIFKNKKKPLKHISVSATVDVKSKSVGTVSAFKRCFCLLTFKKGKNTDKPSESIKTTRRMVYKNTNVLRDKNQDKKLDKYFRKSELKTKQTLLQENYNNMEILMPYSKKKFKKSTSQMKIVDVYALISKSNKQGIPYHVFDDIGSVEHPDIYNGKKIKKLSKHEENIKINSKSSKHVNLPRKRNNDASVEYPDIYNSRKIKKLYKHEENIKINSKSSKHIGLPRGRKNQKMDKHDISISELNVHVDSKSSYDISNSHSNKRKHKKRKGQDERGLAKRSQDAYPDSNTLKTDDKINERDSIDTCICLQRNPVTKFLTTGFRNLSFGFPKIFKCMNKDQGPTTNNIRIQSKHLLQADKNLNFRSSQTVCLTTCVQPVTTAARSFCKSPPDVCDNISCLKIKDNINSTKGFNPIKRFNTNIQQIKYKKNFSNIQTCITSQIKNKPVPDVKPSVCDYTKVSNTANSRKFEDKTKNKHETLPCCAGNHFQPKPECYVTRRKSVPGFFKCFYRKKNIPLAKQECPICMKNILFNVPPSTCGNNKRFAGPAGTKCIKSESEIKKTGKKKTRKKKKVSVKSSPLFDMIVDAKTMKLTNKDEIYRTLRIGCEPHIAKQNLKKSSKKKIQSVIDLVIDRDSANVLNCEQIFRALGTDSNKRNKRTAFTLKNELTRNQSYCRHLQKDKTPYQACTSDTPQDHPNHCTCCFCSNDAEVRKQHQPQNCTCCICRYGCRYGIKSNTKEVDEYGIKGRTKEAETYSTESEKLIANKNYEERLKSQEPGIIATLSSGVQNLVDKLCIKSCYCGQKICAKETEKLGKIRKAKVPPPCVCGSAICKTKHTRKTPYYRNKEEQKKIKAKMKKQRRERLKKESLARIKRYAKKDAAKRRKIKRQDQKAMKDLDKYINHPDVSSWALLSENASDIGRFGQNTCSNMLKSFIRGVCHPRDIQNRLKLAKANPRATATKALQNFRDCGFSGTVARVRNRCAAMQTSKYLIAKVEANPITNYLFHLRANDPKERLLKKKPEKEPEPYQCSALLTSLRKKPCMWLYQLCPWFYPHCLSLLSFWRQFTDVILFILAVGIWSPCILLTEFCRSIMCCFMCAGG